MSGAALKMPAHEACSLFPMIGEEEYQALKRDIVEHGQREPVIVVDGAVVDGRNRLRACRELGLEPVVREMTAKDAGDIQALVVSLNLHRRHLTPAEKGELLAAYMDRVGAKAGKTGRAKKSDTVSDIPKTLPDVAEELGINERTARRHVAKARSHRNGTDRAARPKVKRLVRRPDPSEKEALLDCASCIEEAVADVLLAFPGLRAAIAARLELIAEGLRQESRS